MFYKNSDLIRNTSGKKKIKFRLTTQQKKCLNEINSFTFRIFEDYKPCQFHIQPFYAMIYHF